LDRVRATTKVQGNRKIKKAKLRAPEDLKKLKAFKDILNGKQLDYPYLSDIENRILTLRTLGKSRANIARALSGGHSRHSYTSSRVKYLLQTARQKIRENRGRIRMANISATIRKEVVDEADRIAEHHGKTRSRIIYEALVEYVCNHEVPHIYESEHFTVDFNRFNRLRKHLMDLENQGLIVLSGSGETAELHFSDGTVLGAQDEIRP